MEETPIYSRMAEPAGTVQQPPLPFGSPMSPGVPGTPVPQPEPLNPNVDMSAASVQAQIDAAISAVEAKYEARVKQLEDQLAAQNQPARVTAEHTGGPGYDVAPTWSLWHQELARAGKLTEEALHMVGLGSKVA
jgi:hypothetical protein